MAKVQDSFDVEVVYCGAWGGLPEANYTSKIIRTVFPNAKINQYTPGKTSNLVIKFQGNVIYDKRAGDGAMKGAKPAELCNKLKSLLAKWDWNKWCEQDEVC